MKIGIDVSQIVYPGGVGIYTQNLINHLLSLDNKNEYLFFASSLRQRPALDRWFSHLKKQSKNKKIASKFSFFPAQLTQYLFNQLRFPKIEGVMGEIDLFHTSDWTEPPANCPKVTTIHDLAPLIYPRKHHPQIVNVFKRKLNLIKKESSLIIAVSKKTKKDLMKKLGIKAGKIRVIYEALNQEFNQAKADASIIRQHKLSQFIISDAIKNPRKNLVNLLKAFRQIKNKKIKLVLVGQPMWQQEQIEKQIASSALENQLVRVGQVSINQLKALYQKALLTVFPSFYEGFGLPLLEALSCGCPVACAGNSSFPEVGGQAALYFSPSKPKEISQKINQLIRNQSLRLKLKQAGLKQVKKFSWQKTAKQTLKVYQEAVR